jgi:hypothetical protein
MLGIAFGFKRSTFKVTVTINRSVCYVFSVICCFCAISFVSFDLQYSNFIYRLLIEGGAWDCFWVYTWIEDGSSDSRFSKLVDFFENYLPVAGGYARIFDHT